MPQDLFDYDYYNAIKAGYGPEDDGHWPSRVDSGPNEGLILKLINHETLLKSLLEDSKSGYNFIYQNPHTNRTYTFDNPGSVLGKRFAEKSYGK